MAGSRNFPYKCYIKPVWNLNSESDILPQSETTVKSVKHTRPEAGRPIKTAWKIPFDNGLKEFSWQMPEASRNSELLTCLNFVLLCVPGGG